MFRAFSAKYRERAEVKFCFVAFVMYLGRRFNCGCEVHTIFCFLLFLCDLDLFFIYLNVNTIIKLKLLSVSLHKCAYMRI